jgi:hypothetical protein
MQNSRSEPTRLLLGEFLSKKIFFMAVHIKTFEKKGA